MKPIRVNLKDAPEVKAVILAAFPSYRKKTGVLWPSESVTLSGTYWDGGSRSEYRAVDLATKRNQGAPQYPPPQFGGPKIPPVVFLPNGIAIIECGTFCGKPSEAHLFVRPDNLARFLPTK